MPIRNIAVPFAELSLPVGVRRFSGGPHWSTLGGTIAPSHIAAWTPKGASSLAASYVQYGTFGTGLTVGVAPTLNNGWVFDGSTQYLNTNIVPVNAQTQTVAIRFSGLVVSILYQSPFGARTAYPTRSLELTVGTSGDNQNYWGDGTIDPTATWITSGIIIIAGATRYLNGVSAGATAGWGGTSTQNIYIGAESSGGSPSQYAGITTVGFVYYDIALNPTQVGLLNTALGAL